MTKRRKFNIRLSRTIDQLHHELSRLKQLPITPAIKSRIKALETRLKQQEKDIPV